MKIRRNDVVIAMRGRERQSGRTGKVLQVLGEGQRALVEGMNLVKRHMRKSQENPQGKIVEREAPLSIANLRLYCPDCKKGVKVIRRRNEGEAKVRTCKTCGHAFDA